MAALLGGSSIVTDENPGNEEIERVGGQTSSSSSVVCATYNGHLHPGQIQLVNSLVENKPVLCIALRNPYDLALLDVRIRSIAAYAYTKPVLAALAKYVQEPFPLEGRLTVSLGGSYA
jgi:beta-N-acetylhexosaminidase